MKSSVTKITIGRLYNLGNYEHIRYEITAEVAESDSPTTICNGLEKVIGMLNPKRPHGVYDKDSLERMEAELHRVESIPDAEYNERRATMAYGYSQPKDAKVKELREEYDLARKRSEAWAASHQKALELLSDLGGAALYQDAKNDWDDDDNREF